MQTYKIDGHEVFDFVADDGVTYAVKADLYAGGEVHLHRVWLNGVMIFPTGKFCKAVDTIHRTIWELCPKDGRESGNFDVGSEV